MRMTRTHWAAITAVVLAFLFAAAATVTSAQRDEEPAGIAVPARDSADAGFARDMSVHHQQAVEMSFVVRDRTQDEEVRRLAYDIANTQAGQRGTMMGWLDLWALPKVESGTEPMAWMDMGDAGHSGHGGGHAEAGAAGDPLMPGMATAAEVKRLGTLGGKQAEVFFLQLMIDHHKGGVHMAKGCVDKCTVAVERDLAQGMVDAQESEIALMTELLKKRGAAPRP